MTVSPTNTSPAMTQMGIILGTAAYMSPEQAKGRQVDKRSDVWAFGAVLYEMLSSQRAFKGDDIVSQPPGNRWEVQAITTRPSFALSAPWRSHGEER